jgi:hypothetical protein
MSNLKTNELDTKNCYQSHDWISYNSYSSQRFLVCSRCGYRMEAFEKEELSCKEVIENRDTEPAPPLF